MDAVSSGEQGLLAGKRGDVEATEGGWGANQGRLGLLGENGGANQGRLGLLGENGGANQEKFGLARLFLNQGF